MNTGAANAGTDLVDDPLAIASAANQQIVPGEFIVLTRASVAPTLVAATHGIAALEHVYEAALRGFAGRLSPVQVARLQADPRVETIEPVRIYELADDGVPTGIDRIEADQNPNANGGASNSVNVSLEVAIIDTGIMPNHPDLEVHGGRNFTSGATKRWADENGHGTHVAGTVGAKDDGLGVLGVAPGANLWAVRVCKFSTCLSSHIVAGINWVAGRKQEFKDGAADGDAGINFAAANMSLRTANDKNPCSSGSDAVHKAICGLVSEGVVFALSAGNEGVQKAAYPEVLAVSALADFDGKAGGLSSPTCGADQDDTLADFSNWGPEVDIAAPGTCILSTWNNGGYNTISGTSMASPHVAGAVLLLLHATGHAPGRNGSEVDAIEAAILAAAMPQSSPCGYANEHAAQGSILPLLFVNGLAFGGGGACD